MHQWTLLAIGSRGDVEPFIALAQGLQAAGETVTVAALEPFSDLVREQGVTFASLGKLPARFNQTPRIQVPFYGLTGRALFWSFYRPLLERYLPHFVTACRGAERLVFSGLAFPAYHLAEHLGIPAVAVQLAPHIPTRTMVDPFFATHPLAGHPRFNAWSTKAETGLMLQLTAGTLNRWRETSLGLPQIPRGGWRAHRLATVRHTLVACSEVLLPRPPDWPDDVSMTGFWRLRSADEQTLPEALQGFLVAGPAPIYVGFGSMTAGAAARNYAQLFGAAARLGERLVVVADADHLDVEGLARRAGLARDRLFRSGPVPHSALLPRVRVAVHHGGIGTVVAALQAGVPSLIWPQNYDQFFWAQRMRDMGVAQAPPGRNRPSVPWLCDALAALQRARTSQRVRAVQTELGRQDGVRRAVERLLSGLSY